MLNFYNNPSPRESISTGGSSISERLKESNWGVKESRSLSNGSESRVLSKKIQNVSSVKICTSLLQRNSNSCTHLMKYYQES